MPSSPFPSEELVRLQVETGSDLAEVFLIDHQFALVERGVGKLDTKVEPGVYKVKITLGDVTVEELIVLREDETLDLSDRISVPSPAPLEDSEHTHEHHVALAADESVSVDLRPGNGAEVFLLTRRWTPSETSPDPEAKPLSSLTLHLPDGTVVADLLSAKKPIAPDRDPAAGATIAVDPGPYLLRWSDEEGVDAEQSLLALEGWQTQVFLIEEGSELRDVSVLMSQHPFDPGDPTQKITEEARAALADERKVATESISESLFGKVENPMLGLFGAHLMLIADQAVQELDEQQDQRPDAPTAPVNFDQALFDEVVAKLAALLGDDQPDVVALSTKATPSGRSLPPLRHPPMLWRSWQLALEASNEVPDLVPAELWRRTIGALPVRPFFVWSAPEEQAELAERWEREMAATLQSQADPSAADDVRRNISSQMLAPRAVIDDLLEEPQTEPFA